MILMEKIGGLCQWWCKKYRKQRGVERVVLYVSEKEIDGKNIELAPGERREVV